jgi:hypothetical protein
LPRTYYIEVKQERELNLVIMKAKYEDGNIVIKEDISKVFRSMSEDDLNDVIQAISCESRVIENVAQQIIHGITDEGWHGSKGFDAEPSTALDKAVREVAEKSNDIAKEEIGRLKRMVKRKEQTIDELWNDIHELEDELNRIKRHNV